jgi:hypothetical protein
MASLGLQDSSMFRITCELYGYGFIQDHWMLKQMLNCFGAKFSALQTKPIVALFGDWMKDIKFHLHTDDTCRILTKSSIIPRSTPMTKDKVEVDSILIFNAMLGTMTDLFELQQVCLKEADIPMLASSGAFFHTVNPSSSRIKNTENKNAVTSASCRETRPTRQRNSYYETNSNYEDSKLAEKSSIFEAAKVIMKKLIL